MSSFVNARTVFCRSYEQRTHVPSYVCRRDSCWSELLYPFIDVNPGDSQQTTLGFALLIAVFVVVGGTLACPLTIARRPTTVDTS